MNNLNQKLKFDTSQISESGFDNIALQKSTQDQFNFVNNYNNFTPSNTFNNYNHTSKSQYMNKSSNLQNLNDLSQLNINQNFKINKPILSQSNNLNLHTTLDDNIAENIKKDTIVEITLNIDSIDRDVKLYPDPFKYTVIFGPIVNSGIDSMTQRSELKNELRNINKKKNSNVNSNINSNVNSNVNSNANIVETDDLLIFSKNPNILLTYDNKLKRIYNPYITRSFENIKFIRLDNIVLPRFNKVIINYEWNYCILCEEKSCYNCKQNINHIYIKDDYERNRVQIIKNNRYIPDDNHHGSLFTDRYVLVNIKEIANNNNLATNQINTQSFTIFPDKCMGMLYWRGNPYYALQIYKDSTLGNITKLSFEFYDSWGDPIVLNRHLIDYETDQIINTDIINPFSININEIISDPKLYLFFINKINEIIKCFIIINYNIKYKIPFYFDKEIFEDNCNKCKIFENILYPKLNKSLYNFENIFSELNEFVTLQSFTSINKNRIMITINDYINNIYWYNFDKKYQNEIIYNINAIFNNYKLFGFKILDKLKIEAIHIPLNKYFQNHLMFVMGQYQNEINTKIKYNQ